MRQITAILLLLGFISFGEMRGLNAQTPGSFTDLKKIKETKFGGGDVWGMTYIYNNADSSVTKVIVDYDAGDYGRGRNEYIVVDNFLIYQRDSVPKSTYQQITIGDESIHVK